MPYFTSEAEYDIEPYEFVDACTKKEIDKLIKCLQNEGYLSVHGLSYNLSIPEQEYEEVVNALHGKYQSLTKTEEEILKALAQRFL